MKILCFGTIHVCRWISKQNWSKELVDGITNRLTSVIFLHVHYRNAFFPMIISCKKNHICWIKTHIVVNLWIGLTHTNTGSITNFVARYPAFQGFKNLSHVITAWDALSPDLPGCTSSSDFFFAPTFSLNCNRVELNCKTCSNRPVYNEIFVTPRKEYTVQI